MVGCCLAVVDPLKFSISKGYPHPDDHDKPITDTPGFKPFTDKDKDNFIYTRHIDEQESSLQKCTCVYDLNYCKYISKILVSDNNRNEILK